MKEVNIKKIRIKQGLSQAELAKKAKVSQAMISLFEQGRRKGIVISPIYQRIIEALGA